MSGEGGGGGGIDVGAVVSVGKLISDLLKNSRGRRRGNLIGEDRVIRTARALEAVGVFPQTRDGSPNEYRQQDQVARWMLRQRLLSDLPAPVFPDSYKGPLVTGIVRVIATAAEIARGVGNPWWTGSRTPVSVKGTDLNPQPRQGRPGKSPPVVYPEQTPYPSAGRIYDTQPLPGQIPGQPAPAQPQTTSDRVLADVQAGIQLAQQIIEWLRVRSAAALDVAFPTQAVAYTPEEIGLVRGTYPTNPIASTGGLSVMPNVPTNVWGAVGSSLAQLASGVLTSLSGPSAMPGGAPIGITSGLGMPTLSNPTAMGGVRAARVPSIVVMGGRAYRSLGTPIAWSGDLSAVKRLRRAAQRIGHVIPHRRTGGRFR